MTETDQYDGIQGLMRILEAGEEPSRLAIEIITYHAAIEGEIERVLATLVPRPDVLLGTKPKLSFAHKARMLHSLWIAEGNEKGDILNDVLKRFQNLRDCVAHYDADGIDACLLKLREAYKQMDPTAADNVLISEIAHGICLYFAGYTTTQFVEMMDAVDKAVNSWPRMR